MTRPCPDFCQNMVAIDLRDRSPQQFAAMIAAKLADLAIVVSVPPTDAEPSAPTLHQATASAARPPTRSLSVFEVAIGPGGAPGMFRVEVVTSPAGEASATVELDAEALLARRGAATAGGAGLGGGQPPGAAGDRAAAA